MKLQTILDNCDHLPPVTSDLTRNRSHSLWIVDPENGMVEHLVAAALMHA